MTGTCPATRGTRNSFPMGWWSFSTIRSSGETRLGRTCIGTVIARKISVPKMRGATTADAGEILAGRVIELMKATGLPNGLMALGFDESHIEAPSPRPPSRSIA